MFSDSEKARIRRHLGYPSWESLAPIISLGYSSAAQPLYLINDGFKRLTEEAEELVRRDLCECDAIERQLSEARSRFRVEQVGNIRLAGNETARLRSELHYWRTKLADDFGVAFNPASQMEGGAYELGGIGAKVSG